MKVSKKRPTRLVVMYALTLYVSRENCHLTGVFDFSQVQNEGNTCYLRFADLTDTVKAIKLKSLMQNKGLENPTFFYQRKNENQSV
jgi:hypothetical protein